jgi:acetyl esterase/lipase
MTTRGDTDVAEGRVSIENGVVYGTGGGRDLRCDVYTPPNEDTDRCCVILVHGGGWSGGEPSQLRGYGVLLGREGFVCVAPEYRLTGESDWPAQIHDVKAAIRWTRANAERLGIDPDRISIEGNSAGAHLALLAAVTQDRPELEGEGGNPGVSTHVSAAIGVYPPTLFSHGERHRGAVPLAALTQDLTEEVAHLAGPLSHVTADNPPMMLIHGTNDTVVPPLASIRMYEALVAAGVSVELHMYADQPHAFDAHPRFGRQCAAEMLLFLDRYVRRPEDFAISI